MITCINVGWHKLYGLLNPSPQNYIALLFFPPDINFLDVKYCFLASVLNHKEYAQVHYYVNSRTFSHIMDGHSV